MRRKTEDTLAMVAGAGIGMLAMYLLDPQSGARRRRQLAAVTREAYDSAAESIGPVVGGLATGASHLGQNVSEAVKDYTASAYETSRDYLARAGESISETASTGGQRAGKRARSMWDGGKRKLGFEREPERHFGAGAATAGGIGLLALGAGLAWLFDPDEGEARRHWLRDKANSWLRDIGDLSRKTGRHLTNQAYGTYAEARSKFSHEDVTDEQLEARVRSELGRVITNMSDLTVIAENGYVTLLGSIPPDEIAAAEAAARAVRGVRDVNAAQLRPRSEPSPGPQQFGGDPGI